MMYDQDITSHTAERERDQPIAPPYVSFSTFRTLLEWLGSEGVPLQFDRSFWNAKFSGTTGTQLMAALRFLGLLDGDRPLRDLEGLVEAAPDERRFILAVLLKDSYVGVPFDELERATPAMVRRWFRAYPVEGHTLRKAISFFVTAAKEAELPMSNSVRNMAKSKSKGPSASAPARDRRDGPRVTTTPGPGPPHQASSADRRTRPSDASRTTVPLDSGGSVTVDLSVDLFGLSDRDREFVLKLIDLTRTYRQGRDPSASHDDATGAG